MEKYAGPERRDHERTIGDVEEAFDRKLREHEAREQERFNALIDEVIRDSFPDGTRKHFEYHQAKINSAKSEAEFWQAARKKLAEEGVSVLVSVVKAVAVLAFFSLLYKMGLGAVVASLSK